MSLQGILTVAGFGLLLLLSIGGTAILLLWLADYLADNDILMTKVREPQSKSIMLNDAFHHEVMSYKGFRFLGDDGSDYVKSDPKNIWDIVPGDDMVRVPIFGTELKKSAIPMLGGIRWIGIPPFFSIYRYHFKWTRLEGEEFKTTDLGGDNAIDYILLKYDTYVAVLKKAENSENVPFNVVYLLTLKIVNPVKAKFNVQHWLETVEEQMGALIREYIATKTYEDLIKNRKTASEEIIDILKTCIVEIQMKYGVDISKVQVHSIDPSDSKYQDLATQKFEAEQKQKAIVINASATAEAVKIAADAEAVRIGKIATAEAGKIALLATAEAGKITTIATAEATGVTTRANAEKTRIETVYTEIKKRGGPKIRTLEALEKTGANVTLISKDLGTAANLLINVDSGKKNKPEASGNQKGTT